MYKEVNFLLIFATYVEGKDSNCSIKICCIITICLLTLHILSFTEPFIEPKSNTTKEDRNHMQTSNEPADCHIAIPTLYEMESFC